MAGLGGQRGAGERQSAAATDFDVILPNLHRRYSGVTAAHRALAEQLAGTFELVWLGTDAPAGVRVLSLGALWRLRQARRQRNAVWHARRNNEMLAGVLLRALGWPLRLVFTSAAPRPHSWITRALLRRMDAVIATSAAAAAFLRVPATVIAHGVDTARYRPAEDRKAALAESGLPAAFLIGCFGRVREQKGTDVFVEAMCRLLPHFPAWTAVVLGDVTAEHRAFAAGLERRARAAGLADRIRFLGERPIEEVPLWHRRLSIYAFTSRTEGFGLTLLEAMASGSALVASRAGAAEMLVTDGETGLLVAPGDVGALVAALEPLMAEPERAVAMGQRARAQALAHFSIAREAVAIAEVYRSLLAGPASSAARTARST